MFCLLFVCSEHLGAVLMKVNASYSARSNTIQLFGKFLRAFPTKCSSKETRLRVALLCINPLRLHGQVNSLGYGKNGEDWITRSQVRSKI
jgi:hypothetical protein